MYQYCVQDICILRSWCGRCRSTTIHFLLWRGYAFRWDRLLIVPTARLVAMSNHIFQKTLLHCMLGVLTLLQHSNLYCISLPFYASITSWLSPSWSPVQYRAYSVAHVAVRWNAGNVPMRNRAHLVVNCSFIPFTSARLHDDETQQNAV